MAPITKWTQETVNKVAEEIEAAVQPIARRYGLEMTRSGGTWYDAESVFKLRSRVPIAAEENFKAYAGRHGLPVDAFGKAFSYRGQLYTIVGYDSGKKNSIQTLRADQVAYAFAPSAVKEALAAAK
jgi:hypothetical protein